MRALDRRSLPIRSPIDAIVAGGVARRFAADHGTGSRFAATFAIVVSELASNIAHHAAGGTILIERTNATFAVEAVDRGPLPGTSSRRGLGLGHGAVARLSSRVSVRALDDGGRCVRAELVLPEVRV